ncbi:hypothetical protein OJAV_G00123090 [Oryzias javanicus]|uniref:Uncharacterized protein n=1 Tax=Oryzias javanicus TaxID=123683 RepID=A0A3S2Q069_ORYJA|nr:hypothetical protein OJAV_G00123090 [Oryzias javanicus]
MGRALPGKSLPSQQQSARLSGLEEAHGRGHSFRCGSGGRVAEDEDPPRAGRQTAAVTRCAALSEESDFIWRSFV